MLWYIHRNILVHLRFLSTVLTAAIVIDKKVVVVIVVYVEIYVVVEFTQ